MAEKWPWRALPTEVDRPYDSEGHSADYLVDDDEGFLLDDAEDCCAIKHSRYNKSDAIAAWNHRVGTENRQ